MICKACGNQIPDNADTCPLCGTRQSGARSKRGVTGLVIGVTAAFVLAIIAVSVYFVLSGKDDGETERKPRQTQSVSPAPVVSSEPSAALPTGSSELTRAYDFDEAIQHIKDRYYSTQEILDSCATKRFGTSATGYYLNGELVMLKEYPLTESSDTEYVSGDYDLVNCTKWCYYDGSELYFIFTYNAENGDEYRLYYYDGELIRWIGPDRVKHDDISDDPEGWQVMQEVYPRLAEQCEINRYL